MIFLKNDYSVGAHPEVMKVLNDNNLVYNDSYGDDVHSARVQEQVREMTRQPEADVHFIVGGTLTNRTCLAAFLRPYDAVVTTTEGHIAVHETGAIEAAGHRLVELTTPDGKMRPEQIDQVAAYHNMDQMVIPKIAYISDTTELGTVYTEAELIALREACDRNDMYLYLDGARLGMALGSDLNDMTIADIAEITDAFYVGGNKCGALLGEMVVITNDELKKNFRYVMRQNGALVAKASLIAMQFGVLLSDGLYENLGRHCNEMGLKLADGIVAKGYEMAYKPESNMIFPIFSKEKTAELEKEVMFQIWEEHEDHNVVRLVTSWATKDEEVEAFLELL